MAMLLTIDPDKCTGCKICELSCSFFKDGEFSPARSRISVLSWPRMGASVPIACLQCEEAFCEKACPTGALSRDGATHALVLDEDKCIGCRLCVMTCPIGGIAIHPAKRVAMKCDLCGGDPKCVPECPKEAITFEKDTVAARAKMRRAMERFSKMLEMISKGT